MCDFNYKSKSIVSPADNLSDRFGFLFDVLPLVFDFALGAAFLTVAFFVPVFGLADTFLTVAFLDGVDDFPF